MNGDGAHSVMTITPPEATVIAAVAAGSVAAITGWLTGGFRWLFSWRRRRESAEDRAFHERGDAIEGLAKDLGILSERNEQKTREIAALAAKNTELEARIGALERDGAATITRLTAEHTAALATAIAERDTRHNVELSALHEHYRVDIERRQAQYHEDMDDMEQTKDREIAALRDEVKRLRGSASVGP